MLKDGVSLPATRQRISTWASKVPPADINHEAGSKMSNSVNPLPFEQAVGQRNGPDLHLVKSLQDLKHLKDPNCSSPEGALKKQKAKREYSLGGRRGLAKEWQAQKKSPARPP